MRADLNVPLDSDRRRSPTTAGSGPSCPRCSALVEAGAKVVVCCAPGPPEGRAGPEVLAWRRSPRGSVSCSARRCAGHRHRRRVGPRAPSTALADGRSPLLENLRFNAGETSKDDAERGALRRPARRARRRLRGRRASAPCTASTPASTTCRRGCRTWPAGWSLREVEVLAADRRPGAARTPWCSAVPRSPTSSAVIEALLPKVDRLLIGGGMCFTFLKAQGHEVGHVAAGAGPGRDLPRPAGARRRQDRAAGRRGGRATRSPRTPRTTRCRADAIPSRPARAWTSARRRWPASPPRSPARRRSSGTARWACSSWRRSPTAPGRSPRRSPVDGVHRGRRRRLRRGRPRRSGSTRPRSATSRPAAARPWSTSRARPCPASPALEDCMTGRSWPTGAGR